ncbi:MAG: ATP-binding protein, partial [Bacteroidota bacterium]
GRPAAGRLAAGRLAAMLGLLSLGTAALAQGGRQFEAAPYVGTVWTIREGMPQGSARALTQRADGSLWFGTDSGLTRFDGQAFTPFSRALLAGPPGTDLANALLDPGDGTLWLGTFGGGAVRLLPPTPASPSSRYEPLLPTDSLAATTVWAFARDDKGYWIATTDGLLHQTEGAPRHFTDADGLPSTETRALERDATGRLWVGTASGLAIRTAGGFTALNGPSMPGGPVLALAAVPDTDDGSMWVGTRAGLFRCTAQPAWCERPRIALASPVVQALLVARDGALWIGTEAPVLHRLAPDGGVLSIPSGPAGEAGGVVSLLEDREGNLWAGTAGYGLVRLRRMAVTTLGSDDGLVDDLVRPVLEAPAGTVWIGTRRGALHRLREGRLDVFRLTDATRRNAVLSIAPTRNGPPWVGLAGRGVARPRDGRLVPVEGLDEAIDPLSLLEDRAGRLWIGHNGQGLWRRDPNGRIVRYSSTDGLPTDVVRVLAEDALGRLWAGTDGGLVRLHVTTDSTRFEAFTTDDGLAENAVFALMEDLDAPPGTFWIGGGALLSRLTTESDGALRFDALDHERMLLDDGQGALWTRRVQSLYRVDKVDLHALADGRETTAIGTSFGPEVGVTGEGVYGFSPPAARTQDGRLFFPTTLGAAIVDLSALPPPLPPPPVAVTRVDADTTTFVASAAPPRYPPGLNRLALHFNAFDLTAPDRVRYRYRLDGFDEDWTTTESQRSATYTNLAPGRYTFLVEAANHQGVWSIEPARYAFTVEPRLTQRGWFRLGIALALVSLSVAAYVARIRGLRRRADLLRAQVRQRTAALEAEKHRTEDALAETRAARAVVEAQAAQLRTLDAAKNRLFENLSHEFRTPLTLVLGPLERALAGAHAEGDLLTAHEQATQLLDLVNQLLDLAKLDAGHLALDRAPIDLGALVTRTVAAFDTEAVQQGLTLTTELNGARPIVLGETQHLERVVANLVSNALDHTPEGGRVTVRLTSDETSARLTVEDTGVGIPAEALPQVFDRFYQVEAARRPGRAGTGIGLALAKELVEAHGGTIRVTSEVGVGSTFIVDLPTTNEAPVAITTDVPKYMTNRFLALSRLGSGSRKRSSPPRQEGTGVIDHPGNPVTSKGDRAVDPMQLHSFTKSTGPVSADETTDDEAAPERDEAAALGARPTLLLVEDHAALRDFLARALAEAYEVHPAADGAEALARARTLRPDLIVSDVMMPEMDGLALTAALRADEALRATPIVLLTARADVDDEVAGLNAGANAYLAKPFSLPVLRAHLDALVARHQTLRDRFRREVVVQPSEIVVTSDDAAFVERVRAVVDAGLGDPQLTVEVLADRLAVSPRQLHRRMRALTGLTPAAFVRAMRLQRAATLLAGQRGTVAEVAYAVGFRSESHFTKRFKAEFGVLPSVYGDQTTD